MVRGVFSAAEIAEANQAVNHHRDALQARDSLALRNTKADTPMAAAGPRMDSEGFIAIEANFHSLAEAQHG